MLQQLKLPKRLLRPDVYCKPSHCQQGLQGARGPNYHSGLYGEEALCVAPPVYHNPDIFAFPFWSRCHKMLQGNKGL